MPTPFEIAQAMALQQTQKRKMAADAELSSIQAQYAPENFMTENALKRGQLAKIPSEIESSLAQAALNRGKVQYMTWEYAIKQGNLDVDRTRFSPDSVRSMINYRNSMANTLPFRSLSNAGKMAIEGYYLDNNLSPAGVPWPDIGSQGNANQRNYIPPDDAMVPYRIPTSLDEPLPLPQDVINGDFQPAPQSKPPKGNALNEKQNDAADR